MDVSGRALLAVAAAIALTPSVTPPIAPVVDPPAVSLTAAVSPLDPDPLASALASVQQLDPSVADDATLAPAAAAGSIGSAIEDLYNAVEPWAAYGANLLSWAVGWVPFAGVLAPQIIFFYDLDEPIVQSLLFNTVDFLSGTISFSAALSSIGTATADSFNTFVNTEINWFYSLLPPPPPVDASELLDPAAALDADALSELGVLSDVGPELGGMLLSLVP